MTGLRIVYPPVSNQEAVWVQDDSEVEALLRSSDFYMIAARAEAKFMDLAVDEKSHRLSFAYVIGDCFRDAVTLNLLELPGVASVPGGGYWLEAGEKMVRLWDGPVREEGSSVLEWFTTEKLIWDRSQHRAGISRFDAYPDAAVYNLLYVGIAKVGDTFDRLISRGHKARMDILAKRTTTVSGRTR
jgi:hypothetical protein